MKNKIWIVVIVILVIVLGCLYFYMKKTDTQEMIYGNLEVNNKTTNTMQHVTENIVQNEIQNTTTQNKENEDTTIDSKENKTNNSETLPESPKTAEEKAIEIVKKDYGTPAGIGFRVEGMDNNGKYIVKVIKTETTEVLEYYFVEVETGTFTK